MNTLTMTIDQAIAGKKASDFCFWNGSRMVSATRMGGFSSQTGEWSEHSRADANSDEMELAAACDERDTRESQTWAEKAKEQAIIEAAKLTADIEAITNLKLKKLALKYNSAEHNIDNYSIGGGLSGEKFASRRHEDARNDAGKMTLGEATAAFKKATGMDSDNVREVLEHAVPCMEWHHAGKLPKSYGGGMKKTYFLNAKEIVKCAIGWDSYCEKLAAFKEMKRIAAEKMADLEQRKRDFLAANAVRFERKATSPDHSIVTYSECNGKYGWFNADKNIYNMAEYHSGWQFETAEKRAEYFAIA